MDRITRAAADSSADSVVTTEKDVVKLAGRLSLPIFAIRLAVEIEEPGFASFVSEKLFGRHLGARR
jgi:tetraacyldisaccharide-1-P 4'-kinase